jgi:hypothetical protein
MAAVYRFQAGKSPIHSQDDIPIRHLVVVASLRHRLVVAAVAVAIQSDGQVRPGLAKCQFLEAALDLAAESRSDAPEPQVKAKSLEVRRLEQWDAWVEAEQYLPNTLEAHHRQRADSRSAASAWAHCPRPRCLEVAAESRSDVSARQEQSHQAE